MTDYYLTNLGGVVEIDKVVDDQGMTNAEKKESGKRCV